MAAPVETGPHIYVSQLPYKLPGRAMQEASILKKEFGLDSIGVEIHPIRFQTRGYLVGLKNETGVNVAVAGVTTETYGNYIKDLWNFRSNPKVLKEIILNIGAIGAQSEPKWTRWFGTHLQLAVALGASYLAMHEEPTRRLAKKGKLIDWTSTSVLYGRKLGWGPQDNRPEALSWDIWKIRHFIDIWGIISRGKGNIGAILPTDTALRTGPTLPDESRRYDLLNALKVLQPRVIQLGDYDPDGKREKLAPGDGKYKDILAELIQEIAVTAPDTIITIEVEKPRDVRRTIEFVLTNYHR